MMPGSTASTTDPSKAKVTSATNGIFVRNVAVAGIFRPVQEDSSKPPVIPEKRRFSALVGDLRPCSSGNGPGSEDFNRRRQSWDTRQKEVPFGQALLRKTPRKSDASDLLSVKPDAVRNGSAASKDSCSTSDGNKLQNAVKCSDSEKNLEAVLKSNNSQPSGISTTENNFPKKDDSETCDLDYKHTSSAVNRNIKELKINGDVKVTDCQLTTAQIQSTIKLSDSVKAPDRNFKSNNSQSFNVPATERNSVLKNDIPNTIDKGPANLTVRSNQDEFKTICDRKIRCQVQSIADTTSQSKKSEKIIVVEIDNQVCNENVVHDKKNSTSINKQTKKVYGLNKRDSKPEITTSKLDSQTENTVSATASVKNESSKPKVYGLGKTGNKKDSEEVSKPDCEPKLLEQTQRNCSTQIAESEKDIKVVKICETKVNDTVKLRNEKLDETVKIGNENKSSKSPPKEFRTIRRTSDVIAAKIQNIFSNIQPEKPPPLLKRTKIPAKANSTVTTESDDGNKSDKNVINADVTVPPEKSSVPHCITPLDNLNAQSKELLASEKKKSTLEDKLPSKELNLKLKTNPSKLSQETKVSMVDKQSLKSADKQESKLLGGVKGDNSESLLKKADSKSEHLIDAISLKQGDKKFTDIEGRMPIKKDESSSDGTKMLLKAANQETDRKSSDSTVPSSTLIQSINKGTGVKKGFAFVNTTSCVADQKNSSATLSSLNVNGSSSSNVQKSEVKTTKQVNSVAEVCEKAFVEKNTTVSKTSSTSQSVITTKSVQLTNANSSKSISSVSSSCKINKTNEILKTSVNGTTEATEISKVEVTKITPSTIPGIVPTVNVLFRTKSPQGPNRDENRKKVVIETYTADTPISSAVIISPKAQNTSGRSDVAQSVKDTLKAVDDVKEPLNSSPKLLKKHTILNLQKQEVATVDLSFNAINNSTSTEFDKTEDKFDQNKSVDIEVGSNTESKTSEKLLKVPSNSPSPIQSRTETKPAKASAFELADGSHIHNTDNTSCRAKMTVVDLGDWNKKFQSTEPEVPRVPLRRRAQRDSLPPSLPLRSPTRFGSLKRIDDSARYLPRSPSQSSLPQRYSYTEMLSKVCSMGVLPYVEPVISKSCSSSSSQVSELWSELSEEQSTATHASEMLEAETTERMRLEKEVHELQNRYSQVEQRSNKMEMEILESKVYRTPELNGDLSEDEDPDGTGSIYKQKYERAVRDMEIMKRRIQQQHEEEMEQKSMLKKAADKRLAEALEDVDEERQIANQWKRKAQKCGAELQDIRLMLEEQMARNGELEKKQRRFDAELNAAQEEIKKERFIREKLMREKEQAVNEKYSLDQELQSAKLDSDMLHEKIAQLNRELDELTLSSRGEEEVTQLKRAKQELERKCRDQEEELEELTAQVQMLEQAKLRLEMSLEKIRQEHRREASVREEEIEEIRASFSKKIKNLEAQLESEQDERHQLVKQKHELERRIYELTDQPAPQDPEIERRLRRDLKRTKALLRDAQSMLEHTREGQSSKTLIRQLKNQLEDSEFAKATAIKARQAVETELQDCQLQLEEVSRAKNEAETRCLQLSREKSAIQTQLEEAEEEMAEVMKKYKAVVAQMSADQKLLAEQNQQISELETERQMLKDQLSEVSHKFEHLAGQSDDTHKVHWLDSKVRDLESKLELEQTTKTRLENQIARLKEQNDRAREECDSLRNKELQAQEAVRRLQRQIRDLREDYSALQQKEADGYRKQHELEMALENTETDLQVTKNDLRLACQRIQDLQNALEDDLDSGTDVPDDSGSDSDTSFELSVLRNHSITPVQRCESIASNLSYDTAEGPRSRTSSFTQELSAFSRMMLRKTSMDFLG